MTDDYKFCKWTRWPEIISNPDAQYAGVYMLGRFDDSVPQIVAATDHNVIYIGETCSQTISARLQQFAASAFYGKNRHSGGWTFAEEFKITDPPDWLFVAILPITDVEPKQSALIRHIERKLIWQYVDKCGKMPRCNKK